MGAGSPLLLASESSRAGPASGTVIPGHFLPAPSCPGSRASSPGLQELFWPALCTCPPGGAQA